ncbi:MAG: MATE family efflux transporter [Clostridia bacterium]|nr:MAG: MATE family efflux transporter [Clostridia bacterium]
MLPEVDIQATDIDRKLLRRQIWNLSWPAILRMVFMNMASLVALGLVGTLGPEAIAAVGLGQRVIFIVIGVTMALTIGTTALVAHYTGAKNMEAARRVVSQSLIVGVFVAGVLAILGDLYGERTIGWLMYGNPDLKVIAMGGQYLRIIIISLLLGLPMMLINAAQQGVGDMKTPMYMVIGMNIITLVMGYLLIMGPGPFPALGVTGAALGEGIARSVGGITALWLAFSGRFFTLSIRPRDLLHFDSSIIKRVLFIGLPAAGEMFVREGSQIVYTVLIATLGAPVIAANQIAMAVQSISFMPGFGFGLAATTLVGQSLGARKPALAERYGYQTNWFAGIFMGLLGVIFFFFADGLAGLFTQDASVSELAAICIRILAFAQVPFSITMVLSGALRGAGDTRYVMYITAAGEWGVRLVVAYILGFRLGRGLPGVWLAFFINSLALAGMVLWRYRSGQWKYVLKLSPQGPNQDQGQRALSSELPQETS